MSTALRHRTYEDPRPAKESASSRHEGDSECEQSGERPSQSGAAVKDTDTVLKHMARVPERHACKCVRIDVEREKCVAKLENLQIYDTGEKTCLRSAKTDARTYKLRVVLDKTHEHPG